MLTIPYIRPVLILAFLGGLLNFGWLFSSKQEAERAAVEQRQRVEQVRVLRVKATARQIAAVKEFERRADAIISRVYRQEDWRVEVATDKLTGWRESAYLSYLFAYETATGKACVGDFIGEAVNPVFGCALRRALPSLHKEFDAMATEIRTVALEYNQARQRILGEIPPEAQTLDISGLPESMPPVRETAEAALKTTTNAGALGVDAVCLPILIGSIKTVLDAVIVRMTGTMVASGTLVVADGPFPIGDAVAVVVGVGGSAWAAHDLYNARTQLVPAVHGKLQEQYRAQEKSLRKTAVAQAYQLLKTYETAQNPTPELDRKKL
jgi:hypothetical protein